MQFANEQKKSSDNKMHSFIKKLKTIDNMVAKD